MELDSSVVLLYFSVKYEGDWDKIMAAVRKREDIDEELALQYKDKYQGHYVTFLDAEYPKVLKQIYKPPFVLYYDGDISLIQDYNKCVFVHGAREATNYGIENITKIVHELPKYLTIITTPALGINKCVIEECYTEKKNVVMVTGGCVHQIYPSSCYNLWKKRPSNCLIISEHPEETPVDALNIITRNRIAVGLSKIALFGDIKEHSSSYMCVDLALSLNRDVVTIPYPIDLGLKNNSLINQGALFVESAEELLTILNNTLFQNK